MQSPGIQYFSNAAPSTEMRRLIQNKNVYSGRNDPGVYSDSKN